MSVTERTKQSKDYVKIIFQRPCHKRLYMQEASFSCTFSQQNQKVGSITFLQTIPVMIDNSFKTLEVNPLVDTTLITFKLAQ